jgi:fatty acid amide hydrolase 2
VDLPEMRDAFEIWSSMMARAKQAGGVPDFRVLTSTGKAQIWVLWEMFKTLLGAGDHTLPALGLALMERVSELMPERSRRMAELGEQMRSRLRKEIGNGVLLFPSMPNPAPKHNHLIAHFIDASAYCIFNVMELPVTHIPLGLSRDTALPLGLQIVANSRQDHVSIAVALLLEKECDFVRWAPPRAPRR